MEGNVTNIEDSNPSILPGNGWAVSDVTSFISSCESFVTQDYDLNRLQKRLAVDPFCNCLALKIRKAFPNTPITFESIEGLQNLGGMEWWVGLNQCSTWHLDDYGVCYKAWVPDSWLASDKSAFCQARQSSLGRWREKIDNLGKTMPKSFIFSSQIRAEEPILESSCRNGASNPFHLPSNLTEAELVTACSCAANSRSAYLLARLENSSYSDPTLYPRVGYMPDSESATWTEALSNCTKSFIATNTPAPTAGPSEPGTLTSIPSFPSDASPDEASRPEDTKSGIASTAIIAAVLLLVFAIVAVYGGWRVVKRRREGRREYSTKSPVSSSSTGEVIVFEMSPRDSNRGNEVQGRYGFIPYLHASQQYPSVTIPERQANVPEGVVALNVGSQETAFFSMSNSGSRSASEVGDIDQRGGRRSSDVGDIRM